MDKAAAIAAKDFTYVSVSYLTEPDERAKADGHNTSLKFDHFIILTPSKPLARQAAIEIVRQRIGQPVVAKLSHGKPNSGATVNLYPRNYVGWAKDILKKDPSSVYTVQTGAVSVSN